MRLTHATLRAMLWAVLTLAFTPVLHAADNAGAIAARSAATKPNVLILYADDLGYGDVKAFNPDRCKIATPNLDRLAAQGMRFTDAHSSSAVCSPSRYTLLTGRYHWRTRLQAGIVNLWEQPLIPPDRVTLGTLAKQQGYRTAAIGKWHLGWDWPIAAEDRALLKAPAKEVQGSVKATPEHLAAWRRVFTQPIAGGPVTRGFDLYFGTDVPNWPPFGFIENDRFQGVPSEYLPAENFRTNLATVQGPANEGWKLDEVLPRLTQRTVQYIENAAETREPFLLYVPLTSPHTPLAVSEPWRGKSGLNDYADFVMESDAAVGQILDALDRKGLTDSTLVIFTSDNGCAPYSGVAELEKRGHYPSGPLRGYKFDVWEGGHRVPLVVRWPGRVKAGSQCEQLVAQADVLATLAEVWGVTLAENVGEDSFSLLPLLQGGSKPVRQSLVACSGKGVPSLRLGGWKYIPAPGSGGWSKGDTGQSVQLYNLADDLGETKNLAAQQPERVAAMKAELESLITAGRSTPGPKQKNDVRVQRYPAAQK